LVEIKMRNWRLFLALGLVSLSAILYLIHFFIFRDLHHIIIYLIGDIAFTPVEVLIVTLILHRLLSDQEKRARLKKLNMVIGAFFSEVGLGLIHLLAKFDTESHLIGEQLSAIKDWGDRDYVNAAKRVARYRHSIDSRSYNLGELKSFLAKHGYDMKEMRSFSKEKVLILVNKLLTDKGLVN